MAKILNFDEFLSEKEVGKIIEFANRELSAGRPPPIADRSGFEN